MAGYSYGGREAGPVRMGRAPRPFDPALCGTPQGVWQHRRDNIPACEKCREFYNAGRRARWQQRRAA